MRAASIVVVAAMGALTSVTILVQKGASHGLTRALVAALRIGTNILTGSMTVIEQTLVVVDTPLHTVFENHRKSLIQYNIASFTFQENKNLSKMPKMVHLATI